MRIRVTDSTSAMAVPDALRLLKLGTIEVEGRLVQASNATLYGTVTLEGVRAECVYKPIRGERPLWDSPDGSLAAREVAAFEVSELTPWRIVPPTVLRDGPFGEGMCQLWVHADASAELVDVVPEGAVPPDWLPVLDATGPGGRPVTLAHADDARLRRMALLDVVINNADRKGGHVLLAKDGELRGCDHGVCFNTDEKLRTVLWGFAGQPFDDEAREVLTNLQACLKGSGAASLATLLTSAEIAATRRRIARLLAAGILPHPFSGWPSIPWPPF
jgi:uncharacterized repeat protein (TIGR03843 family)